MLSTSSRVHVCLQEENSEQEFTTYTVLVLERNSVQLNDLTPGSKYVFRVQTLTQEGHPSSTSMEYVYETLPIGKWIFMHL